MTIYKCDYVSTFEKENPEKSRSSCFSRRLEQSISASQFYVKL